MIQLKLGSGKSWFADGIVVGRLIAESSAQCTHRAPIAAVGKQRATNRAGPSVFCNHGPIDLPKQSIRGLETASIIIRPAVVQAHL